MGKDSPIIPFDKGDENSSFYFLILINNIFFKEIKNEKPNKADAGVSV